VDHPRGRQKQHDDDQNRNDRPGELHLVAAVDLRRLSIVVVCTASEPHGRVQEQAGDDKKNGTADGQNEERQVMNRIGGR